MTTLSEEALVASDSENHRQGDGYERTLLFRNWDRNDRRRLARVQLRIDRRPEESWAHVSVWIPSTGWQEMMSAKPEEFWYIMPGYTRGQTMQADRSTMILAEELLDTLIELDLR